MRKILFKAIKIVDRDFEHKSLGMKGGNSFKWLGELVEKYWRMLQVGQLANKITFICLLALISSKLDFDLSTETGSLECYLFW